MSYHPHVLHRITAAIVLLSLLATPLGTPAASLPDINMAEAYPTEAEDSPLFRAWVRWRNPSEQRALPALTLALLQERDNAALVIADRDQLADLARLGYRPRQVDALLTLNTVSFAPDDQAMRDALIDAPTVDSDGDGLTDTEEGWWCTDLNNPDSDGDLVGDGAEISQLLSQNPTNGKPFAGWPPDHAGCYDDDADSVPDLAEINVVGLNVNRESTDGDKFDDGQELFGITKYPGYGALPRPEDTFITPNMPGWVDPPGNHPFVAAYPQIAITVLPDTLAVELVTEITAGETHGVGESFSYGTNHAQGTAMGVGQEATHTYSAWQEVGNSVADGAEFSQYQGQMASSSHEYFTEQTIGVANETESGGSWDIGLGANAGIGAELGGTLKIAVDAGGEIGGSINGEIGLSLEGSYGQSWANTKSTEFQTTSGSAQGYEVGYESGSSYSVSQVYEQSQAVGVGYESSQATSINREDYAEFSVSNESAIATTEEWSTATAVDTSHAADLTFVYQVKNAGSDNARAISGIIFNILIGDQPPMSYFASQQDIGILENFYPGEQHTYSSSAIPLSLEQLKLIDLGAPIHIVVEDFSYGDDEQFYQNAWGGGVIVEIDDGVWDNDESIDTYLLPTWGNETYQQILKRYFTVTETIDGDLLSLVTPEYDANHEISGWVEHAVTDRSWWNSYLELYDPDAPLPFRQRPAATETHLLLRFNQDTDRDQYSDRVEWKWQTDPADPLAHPQARVIAGFSATRLGDTVEVEMALQNVGDYPAAGVEATIAAPDETITIETGLVGTAGRLDPGDKVLLSSRLEAPLLVSWMGSAWPEADGHYALRQDKVYTFTANATGTVGQTPGLALNWVDGAGNAGILPLDNTYLPPSPIPVADGLELRLSSGTIVAADQFTIAARAPRDVFRYTIQQEPYTPPLITISYNDAQGNHRRITPVALDAITDDLLPYADQMRRSITLDLLSTTPFDPIGDNELVLSVINPEATPITNAQLLVAYATVTGTVVALGTITTTLLPGPNLHPIIWHTDSFSPTYQANTLYKVRVYATDYDRWPIDVDFAMFSQLGESPLPAFSPAATTMDLGPIPQGVVRQATAAFANTGLADLWLWADAGSPLPLRPTATILSLPPGAFATIDLTLDSALLPIGPFSQTLSLRTNDPAQPQAAVLLLGEVIPTESAAYDGLDNRPWQEFVTISGPRPAASIIDYTNNIPPHTGTTPLYLLDATGNWLGSSDLALNLQGAGIPALPKQETPRPANQVLQSEFICDNLSGCFTQSGAGWGYINGGNTYANHAYWTYGVQGAAVDYGKWQPTIAHNGSYQVYRWNPSYGGVPTTQSAHVQIHSNDDTDQNFLDNQQLSPGSWRAIGTPIDCHTSSNCYVKVTDQVNEPSYTYRVWMDAMKFVLQAPGAPTLNSIANGDGNGSYTVSWQAAFGADTYELQEQYNAGAWNTIYTGTGTSRTRSGQTPGPWCYRVRATNDGGTSGWSNNQCTTVTPTAAPTLSAPAGDADGNYTVSWTTVTGATGYRLQEQYEGGSWTTIYTGSGTSKSRDGNAPGVWCYRVQGYNAAGDGPWSSSQCTAVSPTQAPTLDPIANSDGDGSYTVSWSDVPGGASYELQEQHDGGAWSQIYLGGATNQNLSGRTAGIWCYRARASNAGGNTGWSNVECATVNIPPNPPIDLAPADGAGWLGRAITLTWTDGGDPDDAPNPTRQFQATIAGDGWSDMSALSAETAWQPAVPTDGVYTWQAQAWDGLDFSGWTPAQTMRVYSLAKANDTTQLALPADIGDFARFQVQYGVHAAFAPPTTTQVLTLTLPKRTYLTATLDLLAVGQSAGSGDFVLDVGDDGVNLWSGAVSWDGQAPTTLPSPNLAAALNTFLAAQPASSGENVDVPLALTLQSSGTLYLTNAVLTAGTDVDLAVGVDDLSFSNPTPSEMDLVNVMAEVRNEGPLVAQNVVVTFWAVRGTGERTMLGSHFVPAIAGNDSATASIMWDTGSYLGPVTIRVSVDPLQQITELDEENNTAAAPITVLSRADLHVMDIAAAETLRQGLPGSVAVTLDNSGETDAAGSLTALYLGDPEAGGILIGTAAVAVNAGISTTITLPWTPSQTGSATLYAIADAENTVNEYDETNNTTAQAVLVGWGDPIYLDAGAPTETPYDPAIGFGYLDAGIVVNSCGNQPHQTYRQRNSGESLRYRFDNLLPDRFYHLDLTFFLCSGSRILRVLVDGVEAATNITASNVPQTISLRLDPAHTIDNSITLTIEKTGGGLGGPVVSELTLSDVRYCYRDSGLPDEAVYVGAADGCGWLPGSSSDNSWGNLPYQTVRYADQAPIIYRFDQLDNTRAYQLNLTFYEGDNGGRVQSILVDGQPVLSDQPLSGVPAYLTVDVPTASYADGSIYVHITEPFQPVVSEIALEEKTVIPPEPFVADDVSYLIQYDGWYGGESATAIGGGYRAASQTNQWLAYRATQSSSSIILRVCQGPNLGIAFPLIDGVFQGALDLYNPVASCNVPVQYSGLTNSPHMVLFVASGQKNPNATGTEVRLDAFQVGATVVDDTNPAVIYRSWSGLALAQAQLGSLRLAQTANATTSFTITGSEFNWITARCNLCGQAVILVDGSPAALVDTYSPTWQFQVEENISGLSPGTHQIQIRALGTHHPDANGNLVFFDGFTVP